MGQQIVARGLAHCEQQISGYGVQEDGREESDPFIAIVSQLFQHRQGRLAVHSLSLMRSQHIIHIHPSLAPLQEGAFIGDVQQAGGIELLVIGPMAAFHPAVVPLPSLGISTQLAAQRLQKLFAQLPHMFGVIPTELLAPIGLQFHLSFHPKSPQPHQEEDQEGQPIGAIQFMAIGQESQSAPSLQRRPLIAMPDRVLRQIDPFPAQQVGQPLTPIAMPAS